MGTIHARTTLNQLFEMIRTRLAPHHGHLKEFKPTYRDFRTGDIMHSHANITKAETLLGYHPTHKIEEGLEAALEWYRKNVVLS